MPSSRKTSLVILTLSEATITSSTSRPSTPRSCVSMECRDSAALLSAFVALGEVCCTWLAKLAMAATASRCQLAGASMGATGEECADVSVASGDNVSSSGGSSSAEVVNAVIKTGFVTARRAERPAMREKCAVAFRSFAFVFSFSVDPVHVANKVSRRARKSL